MTLSGETELRPSNNPHLFGYEALEARFLDVIGRGRLHHAYLLCGPKGIGKASFAYRLARHLLSREAVQAKPLEHTPDPIAQGLFGGLDMPTPSVKEPKNDMETDMFGEPIAKEKNAQTALFMEEDNPIFRRIAQSSHTDLMVLAPEFDAKKQQKKTDINVAQARKVAEFLSYTSAESAYRVVIIDAIDALNTQASNALLKILEEPPANSILLLVCHKPATLLPTITSRCEKLVFPKMSLQAFSRALQLTKTGLAETEMEELYHLSAGSVGRAHELLRFDGIGLYETILKALRPSAPLADRKAFAEFCHGVKDATHWQLLKDIWGQVLHRLMLPSFEEELVTGELQAKNEIREQYDIGQLSRFLQAVEKLLFEAELFHQERRQTALLMVSPKQMLKH